MMFCDAKKTVKTLGNRELGASKVLLYAFLVLSRLTRQVVNQRILRPGCSHPQRRTCLFHRAFYKNAFLEAWLTGGYNQAYTQF